MAERRTAEDIAAVYIATFAGRTDSYSPWTGDQWIARREPLTPAVVIDAFRSKKPVGAYVAGVPDAEGRIASHLACLDVDIDPGGLRIADTIGRAMRRTGIPAYLEPSRRGAHVWVVMSGSLPCPVIRRALRALMAAADVEADPKIELRPGQDRLSNADGLGNALRMPLMPHQTTGIASELMEPGGTLVASKVSEACLVDLADPAIVEEWAQRWREPLDPKRIDPRDRPPRAPFPEDQRRATELLAEIGVMATPSRAVRCPFHDDRSPSLMVFRDDRRVKCHQPACPANNGGSGLGTHQLAELIKGRAA